MTQTPESRPITHIGQIIGEIIQKCRRESEAEITKVRELWETLLDPDITTYARPAALKNGVLLVHVKSPALIHQLRFQVRPLISRLNEKLEAPKIHKIQFKTGSF